MSTQARLTWLAALTIYGYLAIQTCVHATSVGHPEGWLALVAVPAGLLVIDRPRWGAVLMCLGGAWLRLTYAGFPETSDQLIVGNAALELVLAGGNPYGEGFAASMPPGSPFVYGPLALLTAPLRVPGEVLAALGTMLLLGWTRSFITLAIYAAYYVIVQFSATGINDLIPAFLLLAGLLALERHRVAGGVLLAVSVAVKPYGLAWFPAAVGYGGVVTAVALIASSAVLWSPLLAWGVGSFARSAELAARIHDALPTENALDVPALRVVAIPLAVASLLVRRWSLVVVSGAAIFSTVLFLDHWASFGYVLVVLPLLGIVAERWLRERGQAAENAPAERAATAAAPSS